MSAAFRADSRKRGFASSSSEHSPQPKRRRTADTRSPSLPYATIAPSTAARSNPVPRPVIMVHPTKDISKRMESAVQECRDQAVQRYSEVHALLLFWEDDDLLVSNDVAALEETFKVIYRYSTTVIKIKAPKANQELLRKVLDFLTARDSSDNLLIVYYVGDAQANPRAGEAPFWVPHRRNGMVVHSGQLQDHFEDADADVLMLWDCGIGPALTGQVVQQSGHVSTSVSEVLTAGAYHTLGASIGEDSYTRALIEELPKAAKSGAVRIIDLHTQLLNRLGARKPLALNTVHRAPTHGWLSRVHRSIVLTPLGSKSNGDGTSTSGPLGPLRQPVNGAQAAGEMYVDRADIDNLGSLITVCFRISEMDTTVAALENWLREAPEQAQDAIKVTGMYAGYSPLISLVIPLHVWALLPECPSQGLKGFAITGLANPEVEEAIESALFTRMELEENKASLAHRHHPDPQAVHKMEDSVLEEGYSLRNSPNKIRKALPTGRRLLPSEPRALLPDERRELPRAASQHQPTIVHTSAEPPLPPSPATGSERKALPTSRKPVKISIKSAGPLLYCQECNGAVFKDDEALAAHKRKHHTRPFQCVFNWAGCTSDFASKNEWKRHVMSQHILLNYWLCQLDSCRNTVNTPKSANGATLPNGAIFNRKDLYTQHLRRMHTPPAIKKQLKVLKASKSAPNTDLVQWEEHLKDLQKAGYKQRCNLPTYMRCPAVGCTQEFQGANAWDDRMEHVAKHLEKAAAGKEQRVTFGGDWDPTLTTWATRPDVGIVVKNADGEWKTWESPPKASRHTVPMGDIAADDGYGNTSALHANGNENGDTPDEEDDEERDRERSRSVIEVAEGQHSHDDSPDY